MAHELISAASRRATVCIEGPELAINVSHFTFGSRAASCSSVTSDRAKFSQVVSP